MITIKLKSGFVKAQGQEVQVTTKKLLLLAIEDVGVKGLTLKELRKRQKLADKIEAVQDDATSLILEDNEFEDVRRIIKDTSFTCTGKFMIEFAEDLKVFELEDLKQ